MNLYQDVATKNVCNCVHLLRFWSTLLYLCPIRVSLSPIHLVSTRGTLTRSFFSRAATCDHCHLESQLRRLCFSSFPPTLSLGLLVLRPELSVIQVVMKNTHASLLYRDMLFSLSGGYLLRIWVKMPTAVQDASTKRVEFRLDYRGEPNTWLMTPKYDRRYRPGDNRTMLARFYSVLDRVAHCRAEIIVAWYVESWLVCGRDVVFRDGVEIGRRESRENLAIIDTIWHVSSTTFWILKSQPPLVFMWGPVYCAPTNLAKSCASLETLKCQRRACVMLPVNFSFNFEEFFQGWFWGLVGLGLFSLFHNQIFDGSLASR